MIAENILVDEKREALEQVLRSQTFARSDRLKNLLRFLCEAEIEGRHESLTEYLIGVEALGRPEGYSPNEDSCVRSRAYELRHRLERYYATETPNVPLRIDIPKGSYIPRFVRAAVLELAVRNEVLPPPPQHEAVIRPAYWRIAAAFVAGAVLMYGAGALRSRSGVLASQDPGSHWTPQLEAIWRPFLDPRTPLLVSFQTRLFVGVGPVSIRDPRVDSIDAAGTSPPLMRVKDLFAVSQLQENRNYTDFGAANACLLLGRLLGSHKADIWAKRSADRNSQDLIDNNVVILGKPQADPDIARLLPKEHFLEDGGTIRNLQPKAGEKTEWEDHAHSSDPTRTWTEKYALITLMPGPVPGRWILSLAGSGSEHLWAMAQFLTNAESAQELVAHMREPSGQMPSSWQVVIRADFKAQAPMKVSYVTHRALAARSVIDRQP